MVQIKRNKRFKTAITRVAIYACIVCFTYWAYQTRDVGSSGPSAGALVGITLFIPLFPVVFPPLYILYRLCKRDNIKDAYDDAKSIASNYIEAILFTPMPKSKRK